MSCLDCNDCNQSPIYPVNTALPGPPGASAFVYIAFATLVNNIGTAGSAPPAGGGFVNGQPAANSAFIAILSTNTPFVPGPPPQSAFNGLWVPLQGVTVSGINVEDDGVAVGGGPFNTLNFAGAGLTGVTVTNAGASEATVQIVTAGLIKTSYADLSALRTGGLLVPGASYWIVDAGDAEGPGSIPAYKGECSAAYYNNMTPGTIATYPHNSGIIVRATSVNSFDKTAIYLARVAALAGQSTVFKKGATYNIGDRVVSYNQIFEALTPSFTANLEPADDPVNWDYKFKDDDGIAPAILYITEPQFCIYEFVSPVNYGVIRARWDNKGNILKNTNGSPTSNEFMKKVFRWGMATVYNNVISFFDDSTRRLAADPKRSPSFNNHKVNYNNIWNFYSNNIDNELLVNTSNFSDPKNYGTRFIDVYLQGAQGEFTGNTLNNATIANLITNVGSTTQLRFSRNTITDSVIYNVNIPEFRNNQLTNGTVIGDVFYFTLENTGLGSGYSNLFESTFDTVLTNVLENNAGAKGWFQTSAGAGTGVTPLVSTSIFNFGTATTNAQVGDLVYVVSYTGDATLVGRYFTIVNILSSTAFEVDGLLPSSSGTMAGRFHIPSIKTSFGLFENNILDNTVIRCINKNLGSSATFKGNKIYRSFFENYPPRPADVPNVVINDWAYSSTNAEIGNTFTGFSYNNIEESVFIGNKISGAFYSNTIKNTIFYKNNDATVATGGFQGTMYANDISGDKGSQLNPYFVQVASFSGVRFTLNRFESTSQFITNTLRSDTMFSGVNLKLGSRIRNSKFLGNSVPGFNTGWFNVTVETDVETFGNVFEGRGARFSDLVITKKAVTSGYQSREVMFINNINDITVRDLAISGAGKGSVYNELKPQLFGANFNGVVNISNVVEAPGTPNTITYGAVTYTLSKFTMNITMHIPHLMNYSFIGRPVNYTISGFNTGFWTVISPATAGAGFPNGRIINSIPPTTSSNFCRGTATITGIVDDYTFTCEISQGLPGPFGNGYFLSSLDNSTDGGSPSTTHPLGTPGIPTALGAYDVANDPHGNIFFTYWFNQYYPGNPPWASSSTLSTFGPGVFEASTRILMRANPATYTIPVSPLGNRKFYLGRNYNAGGNPTPWLYDGTTKTITLPHFIDSMSSTVILGASEPAGPGPTTYQVDFIENMPDNLPVRFIAMPGIAVQFNLADVNTLPIAANRIIEVNGQTTLTISSYFIDSTTGVFNVFDELILIRRGNIIKVDDRVIHS